MTFSMNCPYVEGALTCTQSSKEGAIRRNINQDYAISPCLKNNFHCMRDVKARPSDFNTMFFMKFHEAHLHQHTTHPTTLHSS
jgi:hypothetical protein